MQFAVLKKKKNQKENTSKTQYLFGNKTIILVNNICAYQDVAWELTEA